MSLDNSTVVPLTGSAYTIDQSLRFTRDTSAFLRRTFPSAGNRQKFTWSGWLKRTNIDSTEQIFSTGDGSGSNQDQIRMLSDGRLSFASATNDNNNLYLQTTAKYRDLSAWYHIVVSVDSTQSTSSNRAKIYVNGEQVTDFDNETYCSQNYNFRFNNTVDHNFGRLDLSTDNYFNGYLAEVYWIDGQQLDPTSFGKTGTYGEWKPIEYTGSYGTNGFYLPFKNDYSVEGMSSVVYRGNGSTQYIGGVGFQPDIVWTKARTNSNNHLFYDSVRGVQRSMNTNGTGAEDTTSTTKLSSFDPDGFTIGSNGSGNTSGIRYVGWCWDMGGSNASNTDGSITSTVRANTTYGQSIVSYSGNSTNGSTVGHGLNSAPEMVIIKCRSRSDEGWWTQHKDLSSGQHYLRLNTDSSESNAGGNIFNDFPTSSVLKLQDGRGVNQTNETYIAYCFHSVTGYSKFGSYTGNGVTTGNSITTGFEPAFVMIKRINSTASWSIYDNVRDAINPRTKILKPNLSNTETDSTDVSINFDSNGFDVIEDDGGINSSGSTYIYMAFADTREFAYWLDQSGNNNDFETNRISATDVVLDSPTNNFATWNPLIQRNGTGFATFSEGNLNAGGTSTYAWGTIPLPSSGKYYFEAYVTAGTSTGGIGISNPVLSQDSDNSETTAYKTNGSSRVDNAETASAYDVMVGGDVIGVAVNIDSNQVTFYRNGTTQGTVTASNYTFEGHTIWEQQGANWKFLLNAGQDSSFAGNKAAQGNTDGNSIGDFYYTPPSGYLALCTANLPDPAVIPSKHFNTVLYTGNSSTNAITGVGFQPDFVWLKKRSTTGSHRLLDVVRGVTKNLASNLTNAESTDTDMITSFDSDGFTLGSNGGTNTSSVTHVSWNWKANGSGVSNTNGSITSTVSANQDAGFSIVSYTGNGTIGATIGHGLSSAPEMLIVKNRETSGQSFMVYHSGNTSAPETDFLRLESTNATQDYNGAWNDTAPTSSVFTVRTDTNVNASGTTYIAYCFHSVEGFSKVGTYTGNEVTDGTFVYTGFKPAFMILKRTDEAHSWRLFDSKRNDYNTQGKYLTPDSSGAEGTTLLIDFLSNGFKIRNNNDGINGSGSPHIYIAFAENPFKYTNAR